MLIAHLSFHSVEINTSILKNADEIIVLDKLEEYAKESHVLYKKEGNIIKVTGTMDALYIFLKCVQNVYNIYIE